MKTLTLLVVGSAMMASFAGGVGYARWNASAADVDAVPASAAQAVPAFAAAFSAADPAGDAKDVGLSRVGYGPACLISCERLPAEPNSAGPAAAMFDIVDVGFDGETADAILLHLRVAKLTKGFPELATGADRRVAEYSVCWKPAPENATRCALLDAAPHHDAVTLAGSFHIRGADACNDWSWCSSRIDVDVSYGEPGEVRFRVPKQAATMDGAPLVLAELSAASGWFSTNKAIPLWHLAWTVHANGDHQHEHVGLLEPADIADRAAVDHEPVALVDAPTLVAPEAAAGREPLMMPGAGNLAGAGGIRDYPELDLVAFDLREEGGDLVATYQMAKFDAVPAYDIQFATIFGVRDGTTYEVGLMRSGGEPYGYAGRCVSFGCHDGFLSQVPFKVLPGGLVEVRAPLATWKEPALAPGAVVDHMIAYTMYGEGSVDLGTAGAPVYGNVHSGSVVDVAFGGAPYVLGTERVVEFAEPAHDHEHKP